MPLFASSAADMPQGVVSAAEYADTRTDVSDALQALIDANPNRTIWFPDGEYRLRKPLRTPADPRKSVDLRLSGYAILRADADFTGGAIVRLGGKDPFNDTHTPGSNYGLQGGIVDGAGVADGIAIESGRETAVQDVAIKNTPVGIYIAPGANSGSSDADVRHVQIIGTGGTDSVGILADGFDNTFTDIRIGYVYTGVHLRASGNILRNVHPLYYSDYTDYTGSCGFLDETGGNVYDYCYSDQFGVCFWMKGSLRNVYNDCFGFWYSSQGGTLTGFRAEGRFDSVVTNMRLQFPDDTFNTVLQTDRFFGKGTFDNLQVSGARPLDWAYRRFMRGHLFWLLFRIFG